MTGPEGPWQRHAIENCAWLGNSFFTVIKCHLPRFKGDCPVEVTVDCRLEGADGMVPIRYIVIESVSGTVTVVKRCDQVLPLQGLQGPLQPSLKSLCLVLRSRRYW